MTFYDNLETRCSEIGKKPREIAKEAGVKTSTLSMWKTKGVTPKYGTIKQIATILNIEWTELVPVTQQEKVIIDHMKEVISKPGTVKKLSGSELIAFFYSLLSDDGKQKALERIAELTEIPKYGKHWGKEITDKITCPISQINEYTAKGYEISSIQYFENGTGEGTATMVLVASPDTLQHSDNPHEKPSECATEVTEDK